MHQAAGTPETVSLSEDDALVLLAGRALAVASRAGRRVIVGIAGGPGSGKSTIAEKLVGLLEDNVPGSAARVPMDGFHMKHIKLEQLGLVAKKGAPNTFEPRPFIAFLQKLKHAAGPVNGPSYSRRIEDVVPDAFTIPANVPILVVEGNYLLLGDPPWDEVRGLLDLSVHLEVPRHLVRERLLKRHARHGLYTEARNIAHVEGVDLVNYDHVAASADRADLIVRVLTES